MPSVGRHDSDDHEQLSRERSDFCLGRLVWAKLCSNTTGRRPSDATDPIRINHALVLTLWAAVLAERLGFDRDTALTLGQAVAGLGA
jgi:hypothetical protein